MLENRSVLDAHPKIDAALATASPVYSTGNSSLVGC